MIVVSPTDVWMAAAMEACKNSLVVSSPYVGAYLAKAIDDLDETVSVTLLTRTTLTDFASNSSDFDAVCDIARRSKGVLSLSALHAKVYVFDQCRALITSANATYSGMYRNRECGFELTKSKHVRELLCHIRSGFGARPAPQLWTLEDLEELRSSIEAIRAAMPRVPNIAQSQTTDAQRVELPRRHFRGLVESLPSWTQLTMEGVSQISSSVFTMEEVWQKCRPLALERFPLNRHVREKLRQQMQRLRNLGLISFLGRGLYERLAYQR